MADIYSLSIRADTRDVTRAKAALEGLANGSIKATRATQQLEAATVRTTRRGFTPMRGAIQQAGYQIGDFAVQVGAGQSALVAFAQQGSQLAGMFGPGGAVIGAIIAIGGAVAGGLVRAFSDGSEEARTLSERISDVADSVDELTESQVRALRADFFANNQDRLQGIIAERERIKELNDQIAENERLMQRAAGSRDVQQTSGILGTDVAGLRAQTQTTEELEEANRNLRTEIDRTQASIDTYFSEADALNDQLNEMIYGTDEAAEAQEKLEKQLQGLVSTIQAQADTIGLSARETALYEAARLGATDADIAAINAAFDQIEAEKQRQEAIEHSIKANEAFERSFEQLLRKTDPLYEFGQQIQVIQEAFSRGLITAEQADMMVNNLNKVTDGVKSSGQSLELFTDAQRTTVGAISSIFGNMAEIAEKGGKDQFNTWKAMASAQAAVNTALAISNALAVPPPPVGIALATTIGALGVAQIAQIQSQQYQGARQMGGSVSAGGRYLVGESGPEIVTMGGGGVVTPSSVMQGMDSGGDVYVTVNNAPPGTRTEERTDDQGRRFVDVFISDMANGGPMWKSIAGTAGLRRQGR